MGSSGKFTSSNGIVGLPYHVSQDSGCQLRGQNCYVEVTIGCPATGTGKTSRPHSNSQKSLPGHNMAESQAVAKVGQSRAPDICERMFIYSSEAVLVPVMQTAYAKSSLKRYFYYATIVIISKVSLWRMEIGYTLDNVMPNKLSGTYLSHLMFKKHSYDNFMIRETKLRDRDLQK